MPPKRSTSGKAKPASALDEKQRALAEEEARLRAKMEQYQKLIEDAPRLAKERERQRREELVTRASRTEARPQNRASIPDRRYGATVAVPQRTRRLRAERRQGRLMFFVLLCVFIGALCWLAYTMKHG